ncbi:MAG: hypothetical protein P8177_06290, partial [Gemmatimonadota bacterium]
AAAVEATATGQEVAYSGSVQFSSGTYIFTEATRTLSLYSALTLSAGPVRVSASIPVIAQNSGAITLVGRTVLPTGGTGAGAVGGRHGGQQVPMGQGGPGGRNSLITLAPAPARPALFEGTAAAQVAEPDSVVAAPGSYGVDVGDPFLSGAVEVYSGWGVLRSVELTGSVKAPLNDLDSGVGTGEWDYAVGAAAAAVAGRVLLFVDVAWWWYGDVAGLELRDGLGWGGGLGLPVSRTVWVSAMATGTNRVIESAEAARTVSVALSYRVSDAGTVTVTAGAGLTETSSDYTLTLGWRTSLFSRP